MTGIPLGLCDKGVEDEGGGLGGSLSPHDTAGCDDVKSDLAWCRRDSRSAISLSRSVVSGFVSVERGAFLSLNMAG